MKTPVIVHNLSKIFKCTGGKNEKDGPCGVELHYLPDLTNQKGGLVPVEVKTGKMHNCSFRRAKLDHPDIVKDYSNAWEFWEKKDVEYLRNEFEDWRSKMIKAKFPNASKEDLEKWRIEIPNVFLMRLSKDLERTPTAIKAQLKFMKLINR